MKDQKQKWNKIDGKPKIIFGLYKLVWNKNKDNVTGIKDKVSKTSFSLSDQQSKTRMEQEWSKSKIRNEGSKNDIKRRR